MPSSAFQRMFVARLDVPRRRQPGHRRGHVARRRAAPHRPVLRRQRRGGAPARAARPRPLLGAMRGMPRVCLHLRRRLICAAAATATTCDWVRKYMTPCEMAGLAMHTSPIELVASSSKTGPALTTKTSPSSLGEIHLAVACDGRGREAAGPATQPGLVLALPGPGVVAAGHAVGLRDVEVVAVDHRRDQVGAVARVAPRDELVRRLAGLERDVAGRSQAGSRRCGASGPCALVRKTRPCATTGVGTGMSPPPVRRQISLPVARSYAPACL